MASAKSKTSASIVFQIGKSVPVRENGKYTTEIRWQDAKTYTGRVAEALIKLTEAERFGVHKSEFRPDVFARLKQADIPIEFFFNYGCGSDKPDFVRLAIGWRIVTESGVAA